MFLSGVAFKFTCVNKTDFKGNVSPVCEAESCISLLETWLARVVIPGKPLGVLLPGVVSWFPVPQPPVTVETLDVVTVACQVGRGQCKKRLQDKTLNKKKLTKKRL